MKVFIAAALCLAPFTAMAADLGLRKSYLPAADTPAPTASAWTGASAGVHAGGGFGTVTDPEAGPEAESIRIRGGLGGLQVGYNHNFGGLVLGLETDYAMAKVTGDIHAWGAIGGLAISGSTQSRLESLGTVRARVGVAMNSALLFATAGWAYGRNKIITSGTVTNANSGPSVGLTISDSKWMSGWTAGGGVEYAFTPDMTGKLEYLYADLGKSAFYEDIASNLYIASKVNIIRAGVNYRF